jgi:hypothetical protein
MYKYSIAGFFQDIDFSSQSVDFIYFRLNTGTATLYMGKITWYFQ